MQGAEDTMMNKTDMVCVFMKLLVNWGRHNKHTNMALISTMRVRQRRLAVPPEYGHPFPQCSTVAENKLPSQVLGFQGL